MIAIDLYLYVGYLYIIDMVIMKNTIFVLVGCMLQISI